MLPHRASMDGHQGMGTAKLASMDRGVTVSILGMPGAGKTTVSGLLAQRLRSPRLSTGEAVRDLARDDAELRSLLEAGELAPEATVAALIARFLDENAEAPVRVLDGYPRHVTQAEYLRGRSTRLIVVVLEIHPGLAVSRIGARDDERADDSAATAASRIGREVTAVEEVAQYLARDVTRLDASLDIDNVVKLALNALSSSRTY